MENKFLTYEEFGAVGDGVTDDMSAIIACHNEANRSNTPVKVKDGASYYIGRSKATATVKTDVDFGTAKFIIDDRGGVEDRFSFIFSIDSDFAKFKPELSSLSKGQTKVDIPHEGNIYVRVFNDNHKIFIREGLNMNDGTATTDCFTVDAEGNIFPSVDWDYPEITNAFAIRIDDKPITVRGGEFITFANDEESFYRYHHRGINVRRANTTLEGIKHYVTEEGEHGAPYGGFLNVTETANVTIKDCVITGHKIFYTESKVPGRKVAMGSYDMNACASVRISYINVKQSNDINDVTKWGIFTSNFSKNLYFDGCTLSRFDAHQGVTNVTIKNCILGHEGLLLIGFGEALIENTEMRCYDIFNLRPDYGALWDGNITVKNCYWNFTPVTYWTSDYKESCIFNAGNNGRHNFGFTCYMSRTLTIDGLRINDSKLSSPIYILPEYQQGDGEREFAYQPPEKVYVRGITTEHGTPVIIAKRPELYKNTEFDVK